MAATVGFQYRKTLEDILREGDPTIPLRFDNHAGIQAINSVFYIILLSSPLSFKQNTLSGFRFQDSGFQDSGFLFKLKSVLEFFAQRRRGEERRGEERREAGK